MCSWGIRAVLEFSIWDAARWHFTPQNQLNSRDAYLNRKTSPSSTWKSSKNGEKNRWIRESLDFDSDHFFRVTRHENGSQVCFTHFAAELAPSFPHSTDSTNPYRPKCLPKKSKFQKGTPSHTSRQLCVSLEFLRKCYGFENTGWYRGDMHEKTPHSHIAT